MPRLYTRAQKRALARVRMRAGEREFVRVYVSTALRPLRRGPLLLHLHALMFTCLHVACQRLHLTFHMFKHVPPALVLRDHHLLCYLFHDPVHVLFCLYACMHGCM